MKILNAIATLLIIALLSLANFYYVPMKYIFAFIVVLVLFGAAYILIYAALMLNKYTRVFDKTKARYKKMICKFKGHDYTAPTFNNFTLNFCTRCGKEVDDRTINDIDFPPVDYDLTDDHHEQN